jgi:hypothetical protein
VTLAKVDEAVGAIVKALDERWGGDVACLFGSQVRGARPADCGALDRAAKDPELPIEFDARLNEFHLVSGRGPGQRQCGVGVDRF